MKKNLIAVSFIAIVWVALAVSLILSKQFILLKGQRVLLETEPVDPRDFLRGDYVTLNYKISTLDLDKINSDRLDYKAGEVVYVTLKPTGKYWEAAYVRHQRVSQISPNELYIKGRVRYNSYGRRITLNYGIESYFVPEGQGKDIERSMRMGSDNKVSVEVCVGPSGDAVINKIYINDSEIKL